MPSPDRQPPGRLLPIGEVVRQTGLSRATIYRRIKSGEFPDRARLGPRTVRWAERDIEAWKDRILTAQP